jgi:hypothetical protein
LFKSARRVRPYGSAMFDITTSYSTGLPALDARKGFGRARRSRLTAQVGHCIAGRLARALGHRDIEAWVRHARSSR